MIAAAKVSNPFAEFRAAIADLQMARTEQANKESVARAVQQKADQAAADALRGQDAAGDSVDPAFKRFVGVPVFELGFGNGVNAGFAPERDDDCGAGPGLRRMHLSECGVHAKESVWVL